VLVFTVLYLAALSLSIDWIFDKFVINDNYGSLWIIIQVWSVYFFCQSFRNNNAIILQAFRLFKKITLSNFIVAIIVLCASYILVVPFAVQGVILTMSVGEIILAIVFFKIYKDEKCKHQRDNN
jgi:O-antigen/teichoic acid export membrane protein